MSDLVILLLGKISELIVKIVVLNPLDTELGAMVGELDAMVGENETFVVE